MSNSEVPMMFVCIQIFMYTHISHASSPVSGHVSKNMSFKLKLRCSILLKYQDDIFILRLMKSLKWEVQQLVLGL